MIEALCVWLKRLWAGADCRPARSVDVLSMHDDRRLEDLGLERRREGRLARRPPETE